MSLFETIIAVLMAVTSISLVMTTVRLLIGPTIPDRAAALDLVMGHVAALVALYVIFVRQEILIDALIVIAILGFLGTVAVARYIEEGRS
ncbi:MAG: cation transporter [Chloroflexia bacterium]|nr:cation transporter [Chloroflexia bacterium]